MRNIVNVDKETIDQNLYQYLISNPRRIKHGIRPMSLVEFSSKHKIGLETIYRMREFGFAKEDTVKRLEAVIGKVREKSTKRLAIRK